MSKVFRFIRSLKVTVVLLALITGISILATFIPQNREAGFYFSRYGQKAGDLILSLGLYHIFRSFLFYLLVGLFGCNLTACTVHRIVQRFSSRLPLRIGPDIIHLSLLLFVLAGALSISARKEAFAYVRAGDVIELPEGEQIYVTDLEEVTYDDGRPKDWYTRVEYFDSGAPDAAEYSIEVNHPLKLAGYTFYQETFGRRPVVKLGITGQENVFLREGESIGILQFDGITAGEEAVFTLQLQAGQKQITAAPGEVITRLASGMEFTADHPAAEKQEQISLIDIRIEKISGLNVVRDPSFTPVVIAFSLLSAGLVLTFFQKIRDQRRGDKAT